MVLRELAQVAPEAAVRAAQQEPFIAVGMVELAGYMVAAVVVLQLVIALVCLEPKVVFA